MDIKYILWRILDKGTTGLSGDTRMFTLMIRHNTLRGYEQLQESYRILCTNRLLPVLRSIENLNAVYSAECLE